MIRLLVCIDYASFVAMMSLSLLSRLISVIGGVWSCCFLTSGQSARVKRNLNRFIDIKVGLLVFEKGQSCMKPICGSRLN